MGLGKNIAFRVQLVTYGGGVWIVRLQNLSTMGWAHVADVAKIHNPYTWVSHAGLVVEESWMGPDPSYNLWSTANFYDIDFKYRTGAFWAHMPSNIGGDYGQTVAWQQSTSGATPCSSNSFQSHYGIALQGNPYMWFMGTGGTTCSGNVLTGGGPSTAVTGIKDLTANKYVSSENGALCVIANRHWVGQWEEWHIDDLGNNAFAYRGNNGKYLNRHSDNVLWEDAQSNSSSNTWFQLSDVGGGVFLLSSKNNWLYLNGYNGNSCTKADSVGSSNASLYRYVAF